MKRITREDVWHAVCRTLPVAGRAVLVVSMALPLLWSLTNTLSTGTFIQLIVSLCLFEFSLSAPTWRGVVTPRRPWRDDLRALASDRDRRRNALLAALTLWIGLGVVDVIQDPKAWSRVLSWGVISVAVVLVVTVLGQERLPTRTDKPPQGSLPPKKPRGAGTAIVTGLSGGLALGGAVAIVDFVVRLASRLPPGSPIFTWPLVVGGAVGLFWGARAGVAVSGGVMVQLGVAALEIILFAVLTQNEIYLWGVAIGVATIIAFLISVAVGRVLVLASVTTMFKDLFSVLDTSRRHKLYCTALAYVLVIVIAGFIYIAASGTTNAFARVTQTCQPMTDRGRWAFIDFSLTNIATLGHSAIHPDGILAQVFCAIEWLAGTSVAGGVLFSAFVPTLPSKSYLRPLGGPVLLYATFIIWCAGVLRALTFCARPLSLGPVPLELNLQLAGGASACMRPGESLSGWDYFYVALTNVSSLGSNKATPADVVTQVVAIIEWTGCFTLVAIVAGLILVDRPKPGSSGAPPPSGSLPPPGSPGSSASPPSTPPPGSPMP